VQNQQVGGGIRHGCPIVRTHRDGSQPEVFIMQALTPVGQITIWAIVALSAIMLATLIIQIW
jgi:hypothetical protein